MSHASISHRRKKRRRPHLRLRITCSRAHSSTVDPMTCFAPSRSPRFWASQGLLHGLVTALSEEECSLIAEALVSLNPDAPAATSQARDLADLFTRLS